MHTWRIGMQLSLLFQPMNSTPSLTTSISWTREHLWNLVVLVAGSCTWVLTFNFLSPWESHAVCACEHPLLLPSMLLSPLPEQLCSANVQHSYWFQRSPETWKQQFLGALRKNRKLQCEWTVHSDPTIEGSANTGSRSPFFMILHYGCHTTAVSRAGKDSSKVIGGEQKFVQWRAKLSACFASFYKNHFTAPTIQRSSKEKMNWKVFNESNKSCKDFWPNRNCRWHKWGPKMRSSLTQLCTQVCAALVLVDEVQVPKTSRNPNLSTD
jgi:hypothetical protein